MIQIALLVALVVAAAGATGAGVWAFKQSAVDACNAQWQADLAKANFKIEQANKEKADAVEKVQYEAKESISKTETDLAETKRLLAEALFHIPLSEVCNACDIPESHVWGLRADERRPARSSVPAYPGAKSGSSAISPSPEAGVPGKEAGKDVQSKRASRRSRVRRGTEKTD